MVIINIADTGGTSEESSGDSPDPFPDRQNNGVDRSSSHISFRIITFSRLELDSGCSIKPCLAGLAEQNFLWFKPVIIKEKLK